MSDTTHWVFFPFNGPVRELTADEVVQSFDLVQEDTYLVPGRVWRDYRETVLRVAKIREELQTYNRPVLVALAQRPPKKKDA